jgi:excisionase family DNA binding protein
MPTNMTTIQQTAERGAVAPRTVRRAIARGELAAYRIAGAIRLDCSEVDQWLTSRPIRTAVRRSPSGDPEATA